MEVGEGRFGGKGGKVCGGCGGVGKCVEAWGEVRGEV